MRGRFDQKLQELNEALLEMASLIQIAIQDATNALLSHDVPAAQKIISGDNAIDDKERTIEALCLKLLLSEQPVARDLRQISTALKMITDLERIGDHASDISELCLLLSGQTYIKSLEHIPKMAQASVKMVNDSITAFVTKDLDLANQVIAYDDVVDELYNVVKQELILHVRSQADDGEQAFDLMQIAKYYERIGDHAQNLAEWVIFSITGVHKNSRVL
jgi:phosphate transport system protein